MSPLTPPAKWNPEDDLLLKNAVEAGASLESLAKGAVHFSCRFTVRELEERWRSLLYDLNTSTEASACIIEIEIGVSVYNPSKSGRTCFNKVKETPSVRRKGESLQYHYHAARKRARIESHKSSNLGFLMPPSTDDVIANDTIPHESSELPNGLSLSNYGHPETSFGGDQHAYPNMVEVDSTVPSSGLTFHGRMAATIDPELPVGISDLSGHQKNISSVQINEAGFNDACKNFQSRPSPKDLSHALARNHQPLQAPDVPQSTSAFHQLSYSSPPPDLPVWGTIEDVSTSNFQMDSQFMEKGQGVLTMDCIKKMDNQASDDLTPKSKLTDGTSTAALDDSTNFLDTNYIDFSSSCMSFTDEDDLLLIDMDEEDIGDRSCLNGLGSMFLSSPSDTYAECLPIPAEPIPLAAFDISTPNADTSLGHKPVHEDVHIGSNDLHCSVVPGVSILPSSPEVSYIEDLSSCLLNTEDQDIPCNDDVIFPVKSQAISATNTRLDVSSTLVNYEKTTSGDPTLVSVQPNEPSFKTGHSSLPKVGFVHSAADCMPESLPSNRNLISGVSRVNYADDPSLIPPVALNQQTMDELNIQVACKQSHPELVSSELPDHRPTMSISDQEEEPYENEDDDDVPSFSDVEAMILNMDLSPYDQESCLFAKEVSRYQCIGTKKTIIRLEQGARSYITRAISSHGAFAVFYGRRLKYFIKTPEVLVGRETDDIKVDIDLAKEGRANKISRRQAIIKMDDDGCFHLKNIGKSSIFVNSKEVPVKKRINLSSCALIEIKDMRFIFDVNEASVRRHVTSLRQSSRGPKSNFDFVYN
ncbi:hypothetical protein KSP40_PGU019921 [Platanthera guangdongensis]|uniref:FHA domain-containing protein n=1 Tax=Platanthera guangdongensis TaxID=2320717 RepID=A0ABR2M5M6_9ASPA